MALYRVQSNGKAPTGLQAGDEVVTGGGTYRILGVNADGSYRSALSNQQQTIYNYRGSYGVPAARAAQQPVQDISGVSEAKAALGRVQAAKPGAYASRWEGQLQELYDRIAERGDFSYDLGKDPMYRQAREQYQTAGRLAMQDTMGQAAALTGGYGSSYGQQTGQQAYNAYLQQLNEIVPELYAQAREQWQSGEAALYDRYQLLSSREQSDYARYRDQMSDYYAELDDARSAYASAAKLANDNYWSSLEYQADREDAANAQYWKQLAYADKQAAAAEAAAKAAQNAAARSTGTAGSRKQKTASSKAGGRSTGVKKTRSSAWTSDQDGEAVTVGADDSVTVRFYDEQNAPVHTFSFTGVTGNCVTLVFDETVSAKFPQGAYRYDILYTHGDKTTLARGNCAAAE